MSLNGHKVKVWDGHWQGKLKWEGDIEGTEIGAKRYCKFIHKKIWVWGPHISPFQ